MLTERQRLLLDSLTITPITARGGSSEADTLEELVKLGCARMVTAERSPTGRRTYTLTSPGRDAALQKDAA